MKNSTGIGLTAVICATVLILSACGTDTTAKEGYRQYGISCMESGDYEAAIEAFQKALDQSVGSVSALDLDICYYKAEAQYLNGDYEDALETYTALINYNGDARAYYLRGCLYYTTGTEAEEGQGAKDLEAAVEADPDNYELYIGIYNVLSAVKADYDSTEGIGEVYVDLTEDEITEYLYSALAIKGDDAEDYMQKGRIYYMLDDMDSALSYLEQAAEGGEAEAYYYLTQVYHALGDTDAADAAFESYINSEDMDAEGLYEIGVTQMNEEDYESAITCFTMALSLEEITNEQELQKGLILAYEYSGDFESAKSLIADYMAAYPDDEEMEQESIFLETR